MLISLLFDSANLGAHEKRVFEMYKDRPQDKAFLLMLVDRLKRGGSGLDAIGFTGSLGQIADRGQN